ncbi:DUF192 domain-containing protein [Piscinibacter sakaiensis]|uniref:DUF192 domain-containing protein n=1 Tax=Piscinibacter sakaiensis TaxID=1547922 RepID=UPI003AB07DF6
MTQINSFASIAAVRAAALAMALLFASHAQAQGVPQRLPTVQLNAGIHVMNAMVAASPEERSTGLMFRTEMGANEGMLFIFDAPAQQCFWMRNTPLPLSAAFIADDGSIVNIEDMKPQTLDSHCSSKPVRFVLEMHQGWFAKRGLKAGSKISGAPFGRQ